MRYSQVVNRGEKDASLSHAVAGRHLDAYNDPGAFVHQSNHAQSYHTVSLSTL